MAKHFFSRFGYVPSNDRKIKFSIDIFAEIQPPLLMCEFAGLTRGGGGGEGKREAYKYARKNAKRRGEKWMDEHFVFKQNFFLKKIVFCSCRGYANFRLEFVKKTSSACDSSWREQASSLFQSVFMPAPKRTQKINIHFDKE